MVELQGLVGPVAGRHLRIRRLPATLGRSPACDIQVDAPGVWDEHLRFHWDRAHGICVTAVGRAGLLVNDQPASEVRLRNGDVLAVGGIRFRFALSPVQPRRLWVASAFSWFLILGTLILQGWLLQLL